MESKESKRRRCPNFKSTEDDVLLQVTANYIHIIENKQTNNNLRNEKNKAWDDISFEFNKLSIVCPRSAHELRIRFVTIKKRVREECTAICKNNIITGGGPSAVSHSGIVRDLIIQRADPNPNDSDGFADIGLPLSCELIPHEDAEVETDLSTSPNRVVHYDTSTPISGLSSCNSWRKRGAPSEEIKTHKRRESSIDSSDISQDEEARLTSLIKIRLEEESKERAIRQEHEMEVFEIRKQHEKEEFEIRKQREKEAYEIRKKRDTEEYETRKNRETEEFECRKSYAKEKQSIELEILKATLQNLKK